MEIERVVTELPKHGCKINHKFAFALLTASICVYHRTEPMEIIPVFDRVSSCMGYVFQNANTLDLDLHQFSPLTAQFALRLIIGFRLNDIIRDKRKDYVGIIVGRGRHNANKRGALKTFVVEELSRYHPTIIAKTDEQNEGRLTIATRFLIPYLENESNYAKHKLLYPSGDWVFEY